MRRFCMRVSTRYSRVPRADGCSVHWYPSAFQCWCPQIDSRLRASCFNRSLTLILLPTPLPSVRTPTRRWRVLKTILAFYVYTFLCFAALAIVMTVGRAIADAVHSSPHGHAIDMPFEDGYVVIGLSLLLTFSRWVRDRGLIIVPIILIVLVAAFMHTRTAPARPVEIDTSRSRSLRWP
jgi:hypothetical protein